MVAYRKLEDELIKIVSKETNVTSGKISLVAAHFYRTLRQLQSILLPLPAYPSICCKTYN